MENKKISVIIPVYNMEKYLNRCLDTVVNQTYKNLEIIIVNDGSIDSSKEICEKYANNDSRIKLINKENSGVAETRNIGIREATGDYIGFVDSDDYIDLDMFEVMYNLSEKYKADISIISFCEKIGDKVVGLRDSKELSVMNKIEAIKELLIDTNIQSYLWNKLFKRELFEGIEFPSGKNFEDIAVMLKLFENSDLIVRFETAKYYYLRREDSIVGERTSKTYSDYLEVILDKYLYLFNRYPEIEIYNSYNFIINMIWVYTIIIRYDMNDLYGKYDELFSLFISLFKKYENEILEELDYYNKSILYMLLLDKDTSIGAIREFYMSFRKKREEGTFEGQI